MKGYKLLFIVLFVLICLSTLVLAEDNNSTSMGESLFLDSGAIIVIGLGILGVFIIMYIINSVFESPEGSGEEIRERRSSYKKISSEVFKKNPFKQFCGVEIETLNDGGRENYFTRDEQNKFDFEQGSDGSLSGDGAEFRSSPRQGDDLLNNISTFCKELNKREWYVDKSCGLHIHIETPTELDLIKKLYLFYNKYEELFFKMLPPSRRTNRFCQEFSDSYSPDRFYNTKDLKEFARLFYNSNWYGDKIKDHGYKKRYCWFNLHSVFYRGTLEIRAHAGTINPRKINNWFLIHLSIRNKLEKMTPEQVFKLSKDKDTFLSFFNKPLRDYIKERWSKFPNLNEDKFKEKKCQILST